MFTVMRAARFVAVTALLLTTLLLLAEGAARVYIRLTRGSATAGLRERVQYLDYQPFIMFGRDLDQQLARHREKGSSEDPGRYRALLLGGSTAAGFSPDILEAALASRLPGRRVEVLNLAHGGHNARQEAIILALWGTRLAPSLIITLDGTNDLEHRLRVDRPGTFYLDPAYRLALTRPLLSPFADILRHSQLVQGISRLRARSTLGPPQLYADALPVYLDAQHSMNVIARGLGAARIMVLQPFHAYKRPLTEQEAAFTHYKYREGVMLALLDLAHEGLTGLARQDHVPYVDARFAYQGVRETVFRDDVHFASRLGYEVLASRIAEGVAQPNPRTPGSSIGPGT